MYVRYGERHTPYIPFPLFVNKKCKIAVEMLYLILYDGFKQAA
jgi:hypothetical protein